MTNEDRLDLVRWVRDFTLKNGADQVSVSSSNQRNIELAFRDNLLEKLKESTQNSLSLSIYTDHRYSGHSTNDLRKDSLKKFITEAIAATKYLSQDEHRELAEAKFFKDLKKRELALKDADYESITSEEKFNMARDIESAAKQVSDKIISVTSGYSDTTYRSELVNSNGFEGTSEGTFYSAGAEVTVRDANEKRPEDWHYISSRFHHDLPTATEIGKEATERAIRKIGQSKIDSGRYDMLVENRAASRLIGMLISPMRARALQQKSSYLDGMIGKKIASEALTIVDDPFVRAGMSSRLYDGEGIAAHRRIMIEKGVLKQYYIDNYYGRKLGMSINGGSSSNLLFDYGYKTLDEMVKDISKGILVTNFNGGNSNSTTGDFSFGIGGFLIEKGKIIRPVNEMNISGTAKDFWNKLVQMGSDVYKFSAWKRSSMHFQDIDFAGL